MAKNDNQTPDVSGQTGELLGQARDVIAQLTNRVIVLERLNAEKSGIIDRLREPLVLQQMIAEAQSGQTETEPLLDGSGQPELTVVEDITDESEGA